MTMIERDLDTAQATIHQLVRDCSALQVEKHHMRAEIDRLTRAVEEANKTAAQRVSDYKQATEALSALQEQAHKGAADLLAERDRYRDEAEGLRELAQHRVVTGIEHDPLNGKLHGCCARCAEQWPCTIERKRNDDALTLAADLGRMRAAAEALRDDLLARAKWDEDAMLVVAAGNGVWCRFVDALTPAPPPLADAVLKAATKEDDGTAL